MTLISNKDLKERGLEGPFSNLLPHHMSDFTYCFLLSLAVFIYKRVHWTPLPLDQASKIREVNCNSGQIIVRIC